MFHIASAPLSALTHIIRRKVLQQYRWQMLIAAFTLKVWLPPPPPPFKIICMQYITPTLRLYQKLLLGPCMRERHPRYVLLINLTVTDQIKHQQPV